MYRLVLVLITLASDTSGVATPEDDKCYSKMSVLLKHDTITMAPRLSRKDPIMIHIAGGFMGLLHVVEKESRLEIMLELEIRWEDHRMEWTADECAHDEMTIYPASRIWFPWLMVTNDYGESVHTDLWDNNPVQVYKNGTILWEFAKKFKVVCKFDLRQYPVDEQHCRVALTVMSNVGVYEEHALDMDPHIRYIENVVWDITDTELTLKDIKRNMTEILINISLKRRVTFYVFSLIMPSITLSLLPCFPFILPPNNGEKASVALTSLLTYFVMSLSFFDSIPTTNSLPLIAIVFIYQTILSALSSLLAVIIVRMDDVEANQNEKVREKTETEQVAPVDEEMSDNPNAPVCCSVSWWKGLRAKRLNKICFWVFFVASIIPVLIIIIDIYASGIL